MSAEALVRERRIGFPARPPQARQHARELVKQLGSPAVLVTWLLGGHVGIERIRPDAERHVALELGGRAGQHQVAAPLPALAQLGEQPRLADSGLALGAEVRRAAVRQRVECPLELIELCLAPNGFSGG